MEEKIIDGVDVSECRFYQETLKAHNNGTISSSKGYGFCTHNIKGLNNAGCYAETFARCLNNNCYYKQLKRLEQENEKIKKQYNCYACGNCKGTEDYINLEKHHKGLRKRFDEIQALFNDEYFKGLDKQTIIELAKKSIRITTYNRQLETALEEIKKLTVIGINVSQCNCGLRALADDILQIISEVENV